MGCIFEEIKVDKVKRKKLLQVIHLQELNRVLEAGLEPAQPLLAKGF